LSTAINDDSLPKAFDALIAGPLKLPEIPPGVLGLIGISGGSYVVAKGIQKSAESDKGQSVSALNLVSGGGGYAPNAHVDLVITDGGGSGAKGYAVADGAGVIRAIVLQAGGSGYSTSPNVSIPLPTPPLPGLAAAPVAAVAKAVVS
jgi:hypothetical protein